MLSSGRNSSNARSPQNEKDIERRASNQMKCFKESYELVKELQGKLKTGEQCLERLKVIKAKNHLVDERILALLKAGELRTKSQ
jgi:hypothetical protein